MRPSPRTLIARSGVSALLVTNLTNIRYLTGMSLSDGILLVLPTSLILFVDARYKEMAQKGTDKTVTVRSDADVRSAMEKLKACGFEQWNVTCGRLSRWEKAFKKTRFIPTQNVVEYFRRSKDIDELKHMRHAEKITVTLLRRIPTALRSGITEIELAWKIEQWARSLGAEAMSFDSIVAFGTHTSRPHHHPTSRTLKKGMIVQIDIGVKYKGYCSDRSAVYFTGPMSPEQKRVHEAVSKAKEAAKKAVKRGASTRTVDGIARAVLGTYGLDQYFTHSLGHGVGLDIHEGVSLSSRAPDETLLRHEVVTVEPGVYIPGKFGMRLEDMVVVK